MSDVDDALGALRDVLEPSRADRDRVRRGLVARATGLGGVVSLATKASIAAAGSPLLAGQSLATLTKLFLSSLVLTMAGTGAVVAVTRGVSARSEHAQPNTVALSTSGPAAESKSHVEALSPAAATTSAAPGPSNGTGAAGSARTTRHPSTPSVSATREPAPLVLSRPPAGSDVEAELALLREARVASASGEPARAWRLLDALDARYPRGVLLEERSALRAITECQASRGTGRASEFLRHQPTSVYAAKVRRACGLDLAVPATSTR